ncbi:MAG: hypothetical protein JXR65_02630 [Bacteroidales bacterium]|nr:hypothetical protein [Bacteroidales bacterium]
MKKEKSIISILIISMLVLYSCSSIKSLPDGKQINKKLVGVWIGSETGNQMEEVKKEWKMTRKKDGTFILNFKATKNGKVYKWRETGTWWVSDDIFYEHHKESGKTDKYKFTILNNKQVQFKMLYSHVNFAEQDYTFIDTKISSVK